MEAKLPLEASRNRTRVPLIGSSRTLQMTPKNNHAMNTPILIKPIANVLWYGTF